MRHLLLPDATPQALSYKIEEADMNIATRKRSSGIVLMAVLIVVFALAVLAATIAVMAVTDIKMTAHFKRATEALYEADAAVQYVKVQIESDLQSGSLILDSAVENVNYSAPDGMFFDKVTRLVQTGDTNAYFFAVTGYSDKARVTVETVFRRASTFELGLFGDTELDTKAYGNVYTYNSTVVSNPVPEDSLGGGRIASNGDFLSHQDTFVDGSFQLGEDTMGTEASWRETPEGGSIITGEPAVQTDRIDPDPLGVIGGELAADFAKYSVPTNNNNADVEPPIKQPKYDVILSTNKTHTMTLTAGDYYIHDLTLRANTTLNIIGPVNIYLTGSMEAKKGSTINTTGNPTDLSIFSNGGDSDRNRGVGYGIGESIILKNDGDFKGLIYAPYTPIIVMNSADFYGIAWGEQVEIKNGGDVYIDIALMQSYLGNVVKLLTWKERREG
jgi:hypothetical protein